MVSSQVVHVQVCHAELSLENRSLSDVGPGDILHWQVAFEGMECDQDVLDKLGWVVQRLELGERAALLADHIGRVRDLSQLLGKGIVDVLLFWDCLNHLQSTTIYFLF